MVRSSRRVLNLRSRDGVIFVGFSGEGGVRWKRDRWAIGFGLKTTLTVACGSCARRLGQWLVLQLVETSPVRNDSGTIG